MTEKEYLKKNPLCVRCLKRGKYRKASVVWKLTNGDIESRCTECARGKILIKETDMEHKYKYYLNGKLYFIVLSDEEKELFERKYEVILTLWD